MLWESYSEDCVFKKRRTEEVMNVKVFKTQPLSTHLSRITLESRTRWSAAERRREINDTQEMNVVRCEAKAEFLLH